ncbi:low molecular weight phosphotyrosine protein phosphatase [Sedimentimonas flavescens]|uniref:protein-tyrosine-phosphatase n=1 Tax=Sedimentimonas flavescens TaxID=2851012 RepID=A0ABT2ZVB1_9RHOB|nr:low molecular weight phosphotyrosine protein phosphatase [Sedimentimonas flavescens]MCV2877685.1 low molecular weight phosphotyrosine protein phosphatase [Sedimentimonas flavescens]
MLVRSVLVVCVGNICRSPVGERLLAARLPSLNVTSAGINALAGHPADRDMADVAEAAGLLLAGHHGRQFLPEMGRMSDLILVMERGHKREIERLAPHLAGRTMLFDHWTGARGIEDPYRQAQEVHSRVFRELVAAAEAWAARLAPGE